LRVIFCLGISQGAAKGKHLLLASCHILELSECPRVEVVSLEFFPAQNDIES
jgi:hypothetical protein